MCRLILWFEDEDFPVCEHCGKTVTDQMDQSWAPYCSQECEEIGSGRSKTRAGSDVSV